MQRVRLSLLAVLLAIGCASNPVKPSTELPTAIVATAKARPQVPAEYPEHLYQDNWPDYNESRDGAK
jgi:hypothetical protein